jgi:hypothetical protein
MSEIIMAPCYNTMRSLHYRTQSLPESVYTNHMFQLAQHQQQQLDYHHHSRQMFHHQQQQQQHHLHSQLQAMHNDKLLHVTHPSSAIKKRSAVRRSQTNVCDLVGGLAQHRAPLTAGVYEAFLPPPNFNAVGLPVDTSGGRLAACNMAGRPRGAAASARTHSFYLPSTSGSSGGMHQRSTSLSHQYSRLHQQQAQQQQQMLLGSQHDLSRSAETMMLVSQQQQQQQQLQHCYSGLCYPDSISNSSMGPAGLLSVEQQKHQAGNNSFSWYAGSQPQHLMPQHHRSVPNISTAVTPPASLTTPLYVDCSVEYDLGDQPPVPANSEPLLAIHPEYAKGGRKAAIRSLKASPYSLPGVVAGPRTGGGKLKGPAAAAPGRSRSPATVEEAVRLHHKSLPDIQVGYHHQHPVMADRRVGAPAQQQQQQHPVNGGSVAAGGSLRAMTPAEVQMMEAVTRKLSVESRDSGIGLMHNNSSAAGPQQLVAVKGTTAGSCGSSSNFSCAEQAGGNATTASSFSSSSSSWQQQQQQQQPTHHCDSQHHHHYLPQSGLYAHTAKGATVANNNNNSRRFAFTGEKTSL